VLDVSTTRVSWEHWRRAGMVKKLGKFYFPDVTLLHSFKYHYLI